MTHALVLALALLVTPLTAFAVSSPADMLPDAAQESRARALGKELRCMVCQNQSIEDSEVGLARDLRLIVRERITAGDNDAQVKEFLRSHYSDHKPLEWYFVRDAFEHCHALISSKAFVITPIMPLVDLVPAFAQCPRRIFMSATISDDSAIVRTFDANPDSVKKPIISRSLAGVSERMVLIPALMPVPDTETLVEKIATWATGQKKLGTIILTPSEKQAKRWETVGRYASTPDQVNHLVKSLVDETERGPMVFASRYDGMDLPGNACRLVILSGQPKGIGEYDLWRATVLTGGSAINASIAQKIEQGMGRAARGPSDWCVILLVGKDLTGWISRESNQALLTTSTRAQLAMGVEISRDVKDRKDLGDTMSRAFDRDLNWMEFHAESLAELTESSDVTDEQIDVASAERKAFRAMRDAYYENAITRLEKSAQDSKVLDASTKGWLLQLAARAATYWGQEERAAELQRHAYAVNCQLFRPKVVGPYTPPAIPGTQAQRIVDRISEYAHSFRRGFLAEFDEVVSHLSPEASSGQFEQGLADLGALLGYQTSRPDHEATGQGPDCLWFLKASLGLLLEAKSRKKFKNALNKGDLGQLLVAENWFKSMHPGCEHISASVLPRAFATKQAETGHVRALTYEKLNALCSDARALFETLCDSSAPAAGLMLRCEKLLSSSKLRPDDLPRHYLSDFQRVE